MKEMNCRSQNRHDNEDDCPLTGVNAWTEGKGSYAPERKEEDTSEAWKDSEEFQERFEDD